MTGSNYFFFKTVFNHFKSPFAVHFNSLKAWQIKCIIIIIRSQELQVKYNSKYYLMFLKEVSFAHQAAFIWVKTVNCEILLQFKITLFLIYFQMLMTAVKAECSEVITPVFSVTWSSEIILICWPWFSRKKIKKCCQCWKMLNCLIFFVETEIHFSRTLWQ